MAHFGPGSCCRLRKTAFFSKLSFLPVSSHSLFEGFRRFSFLAFQNPPLSVGKLYFTLFSRVPKKRMCLRLKENYSFLILYSQRCFLVLSIFQNPWNATLGSLIWNFCVAASGRSLAWTGRPSPEKHEKCLWPQQQAHFSKNMFVAHAACVLLCNRTTDSNCFC